MLSADGEWAARAIGSEVGYVKGFIQGSWYRQLPATRQMVVALRGALGAAHGFARAVTVLDPDGRSGARSRRATGRCAGAGPSGQRTLLRRRRHDEPWLLTDQLANEDTISPGGFPTGGNGKSS